MKAPHLTFKHAELNDLATSPHAQTSFASIWVYSIVSVDMYSRTRRFRMCDRAAGCFLSHSFLFYVVPFFNSAFVNTFKSIP